MVAGLVFVFKGEVHFQLKAVAVPILGRLNQRHAIALFGVEVAYS